MDELTLESLRGFLMRAVGEDESIDVSGDVVDTPLAELGIDSLAVIATTSGLEKHFQIKIPEEEASEIDTPGDFLTVINRHLGGNA